MMSNVSIATATKEERQKWLDKAKKTRYQAKIQKEKKFIEIQSRSIDELKKYSDKLNFSLMAMKVDKLSEGDKKKLLEALLLIDEI
jgi:hypothetical protein